MASVLFIAHVGHILIDGPLFLSPIAILAAGIYASGRRERRREAADHASSLGQARKKHEFGEVREEPQNGGPSLKE
jgi:hypothetical protein